ncbi:hypothetical protein AB0395_21485 [Streptosporangium sp. NPDC051023]
MSNFTLSVQVPGEWGRHVQTIVITVVIVILAALGTEINLPVSP